MQTHNLTQGSAEWHAHRARHYNASDAPAMMGVSTKRTRTQLLHEMHIGLAREHSDYVQERVLEPGHLFEALARPYAAKELGEDLYPVVGTLEVPGISRHLSASFDGMTMLEDQAWEHKRLNAELRASLQKPGCTGRDLPLEHQVQMEQECIIAGMDSILFTASEWEGEKLLAMWHVRYDRNEELAAQIIAGWKQFDADLAAYVPVEVIEKPKGAAVRALPTVLVRVEGKVVSSNLEPFRLAAMEMIESVKTDLQTDQDFADAKQFVKFFEDGEDRLDRLKDDILAQTMSIGEVFKTVDHIKALMRQKRLSLDKLVTKREQDIRGEIVQEHQALLDQHVAHLNARLGSQWIGRFAGAFGDAIKGKRTVASVRDAASTLLAKLKIELNERADRLEMNRKSLITEDGADWFFLFADFAQMGVRPLEDFKAISFQRVQNHKDAEAKRAAEILARQEAEAKRRADEEAARVAAAAQAAAAAAAAAAAPVPVPPPPAELAALPVVGSLQSTGRPGSGEFSSGTGVFAPAPQPAAQVAQAQAPQPVAEKATLNMGHVCNRLGITLTEKFVVETLKVPVRERAARSALFSEEDFMRICQALLQHIIGVRDAASAPF